MARAYVFTLNNYTDENVERLRSSVGKAGIKYIGWGYEIAPTTGTPHLQGYMQSSEKMKQRIHKATGLFVDLAMGSYEDNAKYTQKDGDWEEHGVANKEHKGHKQGQREDLAGVKRAIEQGKSYEEICEEHFETAAKFSRFIREQVQARDTNTELISLRSGYESASLRGWQRDLVGLIVEDPHPRKIYWIWEDKGNTGKSWMTKYLAAMHNACIMTVGKKADMAYLYSKKPSKVVVFDLSRTTAPGEGREHFLDGAYSLAEDLKNGMVTSYKYESANVLTTGCHVIFFANFQPDLTKWSADRYAIRNI